MGPELENKEFPRLPWRQAVAIPEGRARGITLKNTVIYVSGNSHLGAGDGARVDAGSWGSGQQEQ